MCKNDLNELSRNLAGLCDEASAVVPGLMRDEVQKHLMVALCHVCEAARFLPGVVPPWVPAAAVAASPEAMVEALRWLAEGRKARERKAQAVGEACAGNFEVINGGLSTEELKFGHRGGNQPVKDLRTGQISITSQNHGFAVDADSLPSNVQVTHINLNDQTVEGLRCTDAVRVPLSVFGKLATGVGA